MTQTGWYILYQTSYTLVNSNFECHWFFLALSRQIALEEQAIFCSISVQWCFVITTIKGKQNAHIYGGMPNSPILSPVREAVSKSLLLVRLIMNFTGNDFGISLIRAVEKQSDWGLIWSNFMVADSPSTHPFCVMGAGICRVWLFHYIHKSCI